MIDLLGIYRVGVKSQFWVDMAHKINKMIDNLRNELETKEGEEDKKRAMIFVARQILELPLTYIKMGEQAEKVLVEHSKRILSKQPKA